MKAKRFFSLLIACMFALGCFAAPAGAAITSDLGIPAVARATGQFETVISANSIISLGESVPLGKGESVTFDCTYTPRSASVDFGLIDSQNHFHYFNVTNGSINKGIRISEPGSYTLAIRNNSDEAVTVKGTVNY